MRIEERFKVAVDPSTSVEMLDQLAGDPEASIRASVARHRNTEGETLLRLAVDEVWQVRAIVAGRPEIETHALLTLARDPCDVVQLAARKTLKKRKGVDLSLLPTPAAS
jgi:hypothetical protein